MTVTSMLLALLGLVAAAPQAQAGAGGRVTYVVFVCEDGSDASLVAAAYFNKLARERGLAAVASFRGVDPENHLSMRAVDGLKADGVPIPVKLPGTISQIDVDEATHIVAIGVTLPAIAAESGKAASWDDVPGDRGYRTMRDAIVRHVLALLDPLQ
jgi:arsenate reductase (thioredoxin)